MKQSDLDIRKNILKNLKRVVIKIGSSVISDMEKRDAGLARGLCEKTFVKVADTIKKIAEMQYDVTLVSSGAIMAGRSRLDFRNPNLSIPEKQACAAIGQSQLMRIYEKEFEKQSLQVAQILLDHHDLGNRKRYLNAKNTIDTLLSHKVIPIINENDTVSVDEIKIGDNDTLSSDVACLVGAQMLVILSDVDGLFTGDPSQMNSASDDPPELIPWVQQVTPEVEKLAGKSSNRLTVGGMYTKVEAAKKTMSFGIPTLIINGMKPENLLKIFSGESVGTLFWSSKPKVKSRKHWIAHTLRPSGWVTIDNGAKRAIVERGKSLLSAGVVQVQGNFEFGNAVHIVDEDRREFARGLVNYNSKDLDKIKGMKTDAVRRLLGSNYYGEVVHRDDLVVLS